MINRGPPLFTLRGGIHHHQDRIHTVLVVVDPPPHRLPVQHRVELKFLVGNNLQPPSPLPLPILPTSNGNGGYSYKQCSFNQGRQ